MLRTLHITKQPKQHLHYATLLIITLHYLTQHNTTQHKERRPPGLEQRRQDSETIDTQCGGRKVKSIYTE
jgi:hypothetical protein